MAAKTLEQEVEIDFDKMMEDITDPKFERKAGKLSQGIISSYASYQAAAGYEEKSAEEKKEMGITDPSVKVYKVKKINSEKKAEDLTDRLGMHFAEAMNPLIAKRIQQYKTQLSEKKYKSKEEREQIEHDLQQTRKSLYDLGFDWFAVKKHIESRGLSEVLKGSLARAMQERYTDFHIENNYLNKLTDKHKSKVAQHLGKIDDRFNTPYIESLDLNEIKATIRGVADLKRKYHKPGEADLLKKDLEENYGHLYGEKKKAA